jgi:hypothetical protein
MHYVALKLNWYVEGGEDEGMEMKAARGKFLYPSICQHGNLTDAEK